MFMAVPFDPSSSQQHTPVMQRSPNTWNQNANNDAQAQQFGTIRSGDILYQPSRQIVRNEQGQRVERLYISFSPHFPSIPSNPQEGFSFRSVQQSSSYVQRNEHIIEITRNGQQQPISITDPDTTEAEDTRILMAVCNRAITYFSDVLKYIFC